MKAEWLRTTDSRWEALLSEVPHDIYHLPRYLDVSAAYECVGGGVTATAFCVRDGSDFCLIPVLMRHLPTVLAAPSDWCDVRSPYGYPAPLFRGDEQWIGTALRAFLAECQDRNIISAFLRMHPLLETPPVLVNYGQLVKHGETVYVDLTLSEAALWSQTRERLRSYINRLRRGGFQCRFDDWSTYGDFMTVYRTTMERLQANRFYRFPVEYFRDLKTALDGHIHLCSVMDADGKLACGALLTETQGIVEYHLSGTADDFLAAAPSKLMLHEVALWAKRAGYRVLHLGGGFGGQADSLLQFKAGFSPLRSDFLTYRLICDDAKYAALCRTAGLESTGDNRYFPQYRSIEEY